jgi:hypothetical protein
VVLDSVKDELWNDVLKHFTLPEGVEAKLVKCWTLSNSGNSISEFQEEVN